MPAQLAAPAVVHSNASTLEARQFLQDRMAVFTAVMFALFGSVLVTGIGMGFVRPESRPANAWMMQTMAGVGVAGLGGTYWLLRTSNRWSAASLYRLDVLMVVCVGAAMGVGSYVGADRPFAIYGNITFGSFFIIGRTLFVPSSGMRTLGVSLAGFVPMCVGAGWVSIAKPETIDLPPSAFIPLSLGMAGVATALATAGSRVIYGLRQEVRAARQLGQYTLGEKLGEGGMGVVFRARHAMLRRPTAIKLLRPDRAGAERLALFEREVQLTSELSHPNTIAVYDYGRSPDGVFYYAMEYLDGVDLETLVREDGPQPHGRVVDILQQVCGSLDEAHERGLVHRDIKPANIILCHRGSRGDVAKVVDFGLVKDLADEPDDSDDFVAGTPAYLAPECITTPSDVGPASDLYAVGAVGYYLLTGRTVFQADSVVEMLAQHTGTAAEPPSRHSDEDIDPTLERLIMACLDKRPEERPSNAGELEAELGALDRSDWNRERAAQWWHNRGADTEPPAPMGYESTMNIDVTDRA
jgi:serine/threonine-protein kinase